MLVLVLKNSLLMATEHLSHVLGINKQRSCYTDLPTSVLVANSMVPTVITFPNCLYNVQPFPLLYQAMMNRLVSILIIYRRHLLVILFLSLL